MRKNTKKINIGSLTIGGGEPIAIQSMLSLPWEDTAGNLSQAKELEAAGCDILRVAVPTKESVKLITQLKKTVKMPIVADIHFDWRLAIMAAEAGADKIRINPGNIGSKQRVKDVVKACKAYGIPIRIGVNSGSIEKSILEKYGAATPSAMVESVLYHASILEELDFTNIVLSMKSHLTSDVMAANIELSEKCSYPIHLGVTHTGERKSGVIKSAIGIGGLLALGIGDTFRVSLTAPPEEEIKTAREILKGAGLWQGAEIISCPTCGRCSTDIFSLTDEVKTALEDIDFPLTVAVMGCVVNGPGEAKQADIGITGGGNGKCVIFKNGEPIATVPEENAMERLRDEIHAIKLERE